MRRPRGSSSHAARNEPDEAGCCQIQSIVLGPAIAVAALSFVGVNLLTPKYKSEARILIEGRENVFFRPDADKAVGDRDRTVDEQAVTSQVQLALSRASYHAAKTLPVELTERLGSH